MRIAYICADPGVPVFGRKGASVHVQEVIRAMLERGADVDLFATRVGGDTPAGLERVRLHQLPPLPKTDLETREAETLAQNDELREMLLLQGPYDLVYERYSLWSYAGIRYARKHDIPSILEVNAPLIDEQETYRGLVHRSTAEAIARANFSGASYVTAVSDEVAGYVLSFGAYPSRVHVIPNGVDPRRFPEDLAPSLPAEEGTFTVGFVGTLKPWHGLPTLVEAVDLLRQRGAPVRLLVIGDGDERERIEADLAARGLSSATHFTGLVDPSEIPGLLASMDVATAPYPDLPDFYFSPLKIFEYMAAGLPVVASRIGQIPSIIADGETGILYTPGNADELAAALDRLRTDPELRRRIGTNARDFVLREHTWQAVVDRIFELAHAAQRQMAPQLVGAGW